MDADEVDHLCLVRIAREVEEAEHVIVRRDAVRRAEAADAALPDRVAGDGIDLAHCRLTFFGAGRHVDAIGTGRQRGGYTVLTTDGAQTVGRAIGRPTGRTDAAHELGADAVEE